MTPPPSLIHSTVHPPAAADGQLSTVHSTLRFHGFSDSRFTTSSLTHRTLIKAKLFLFSYVASMAIVVAELVI
ncbi:hypothetical protein L2E82_16082 [Cichorium intybus]|uniref:Uncharacterized protein n=1 Tax=Cichorium intybus TaxID=13427 RepID=A0ACB9F476_CICIN|nr:hypothetical protein L2E82_16082 [Cichorium intybus]